MTAVRNEENSSVIFAILRTACVMHYLHLATSIIGKWENLSPASEAVVDFKVYRFYVKVFLSDWNLDKFNMIFTLEKPDRTQFRSLGGEAIVL
jgi:hypothetical protein